METAFQPAFRVSLPDNRKLGGLDRFARFDRLFTMAIESNPDPVLAAARPVRVIADRVGDTDDMVGELPEQFGREGDDRTFVIPALEGHGDEPVIGIIDQGAHLNGIFSRRSNDELAHDDFPCEDATIAADPFKAKRP